MIDTVVLRIPFLKGMIHIKEYDKFRPSLRAMLHPAIKKSPSFFKAYRNPTPAEKKKGIYLPRLTFVSPSLGGKYRKMDLMIEFSAPKLLFGNNFDELKNSDFSPLVKVLQERLKTMGISITQVALKEAAVSRIHYGKNVVLDDYSTPSMIINELKKANPPKRMDIAEHEYRNGGLLLRYHTSTFELVFYDKIKDLYKSKTISEKRAFESDDYPQLSLLEPLEEKKNFEVIRMELRLNNRHKIREAYKYIGYESDLIFKKCFKEKVAQEVLQHYWSEVEKELGFVAVEPDKPIQVLGEIKKINPGISTSGALKALGYLMVTNTAGAAALRTLIAMKSGWSTLKKQMSKYAGIKRGTRFDPVYKIPDALKVFEPLKLAKFSL